MDISTTQPTPLNDSECETAAYTAPAPNALPLPEVFFEQHQVVVANPNTPQQIRGGNQNNNFLPSAPLENHYISLVNSEPLQQGSLTLSGLPINRDEMREEIVVEMRPIDDKIEELVNKESNARQDRNYNQASLLGKAIQEIKAFVEELKQDIDSGNTQALKNTWSKKDACFEKAKFFETAVESMIPIDDKIKELEQKVREADEVENTHQAALLRKARQVLTRYSARLGEHLGAKYCDLVISQTLSVKDGFLKHADFFEELSCSAIHIDDKVNELRQKVIKAEEVENINQLRLFRKASEALRTHSKKLNGDLLYYEDGLANLIIRDRVGQGNEYLRLVDLFEESAQAFFVGETDRAKALEIQAEAVFGKLKQLRPGWPLPSDIFDFLYRRGRRG